MVEYKAKFNLIFNNVITQDNLDSIGLGYLVIRSGDLEVELDYHGFTISKKRFGYDIYFYRRFVHPRKKKRF